MDVTKIFSRLWLSNPQRQSHNFNWLPTSLRNGDDIFYNRIILQAQLALKSDVQFKCDTQTKTIYQQHVKNSINLKGNYLIRKTKIG